MSHRYGNVPIRHLAPGPIPRGMLTQMCIGRWPIPRLQINSEQIGTRDFSVEHGIEVREAVFQTEAVDALLTHGQDGEELVLDVDEDGLTDQDPEELSALDTERGLSNLIFPE